jgi:hypothetical protein
LLNSRLGHFTAACLRRHPFSRSYGVNLPSSFTRVLSSTLGYSPHLPVSDCGTGNYQLKLRGFSWQPSYDHFLHPKAPFVSCFRVKKIRICLDLTPTHFHLHQQEAGFHFLRHPIALIIGTGILNLFAIAYAYSASA